MNVAAEQGFYFHHALPEGYVLMCKWIDDSCENRIPYYPHHYIGLGGLVINKKKEVLMIQEIKNKDKWKYPGGLMDPGETI
mmetsp:Transcript_7371/g.5640  ORF Transcript_7371/g.5640 Transcript_7371/m.5640 type:complete len:81 (+) Transcript_7371:733-975(+)